MSGISVKRANDGGFIPLSPMPSDDDEKRSRSSTAVPPQVLGRLTEAPGRLTPTGQGRIKAPPICRCSALERSSTSIVDLTDRGICFSPEEAATCALLTCAPVVDENAPFKLESCDPCTKPLGTASYAKSYVSSSSTVVTNTSVSTCGHGVNGNDGVTATKKDPPSEVVLSDDAPNSDDEQLGFVVQRDITSAGPRSCPSLSGSFTEKLIKEKNSRQGREKQRWLVHSQTEALVRQVAGCIPITRDGRIILVSASRKMEWILPKGGWDADETKEECAARETYEEAGVLGVLGACLEPIDYESSKAKKRRSDKKTGLATNGGTSEREGLPPLPKRVKTESSALSVSPLGQPSLPTGSESTKKGPEGPSVEALSSSPASPDPPSYNYSFVRMSLFPMYVSEVKDDWPENGRLRKLVDIDEAIAIMDLENRPYFRAGLQQVKARGLHRIKPNSDVLSADCQA